MFKRNFDDKKAKEALEKEGKVLDVNDLENQERLDEDVTKKTKITHFGVRNLLLAIFFVLLLLLGLYIFRYQARKEIKPNTPANLSELLLQSIQEKDMDKFSSLFNENYKDFSGSLTLDDLKKIVGNSATLSEYTLIRANNGRDFLVSMQFNESKNEYELRWIRSLPEALTFFYQDDYNEKDLKNSWVNWFLGGFNDITDSGFDEDIIPLFEEGQGEAPLDNKTPKSTVEETAIPSPTLTITPEPTQEVTSTHSVNP